MFLKILLSGFSLFLVVSCGNSSGGGEVKVFNTRAEFAQAMREGKIKQGDKVAVREGNLDDVPGVTKR
jgi:hypothetical protein